MNKSQGILITEKITPIKFSTERFPITKRIIFIRRKSPKIKLQNSYNESYIMNYLSKKVQAINMTEIHLLHTPDPRYIW